MESKIKNTEEIDYIDIGAVLCRTRNWLWKCMHFLLQVDFIKNCGNDSQCDSNLLVRGILQLNRLDSLIFDEFQFYLETWHCYSMYQLMLDYYHY